MRINPKSIKTKIKISKKSSDSIIWGYLVEDKKSKFIMMNQSKSFVLHFPKNQFSYKIVETFPQELA